MLTEAKALDLGFMQAHETGPAKKEKPKLQKKQCGPVPVIACSLSFPLF